MNSGCYGNDISKVLKSINVILSRLIELELKCKFNNLSEKIFMSQFILSIAVLAKNRIKT